MRSADDERGQFGRRLRLGRTEAERRLRHRLRDRRLAGHKFVRQESIGPYVADFCCRDAKSMIEADGSQHAQNGYDAVRDVWLIERGYRVLRFWNGEVMSNAIGVLDTILAALPSSPRPKSGLPDVGVRLQIPGEPGICRGGGPDDLVVGATSPQGEGEGASPAEPPPSAPPHPRLPPRCADDEVGTALSPQAGRGGEPG